LSISPGRNTGDHRSSDNREDLRGIVEGEDRDLLSSSSFRKPSSIIVVDYGNHRVRKITPDGTVSTLAGSGSRGFADGAEAAAQFNSPQGVAVDGEGSIIIADWHNHRVRKITPDGTVSTLAGSGRAGFADGAGAAAQFNDPNGVAVDVEGNIIIADCGSIPPPASSSPLACADEATET
jgi:thiamine pyrophosphate-dependent acetolactate synthase large subunit-like protein